MWGNSMATAYVFILLYDNFILFFIIILFKKIKQLMESSAVWHCHFPVKNDDSN